MTTRMFTLLAAAATLAFAGRCELCETDGVAARATSPDGKNVIRLWTKPLAYDVARDGVVVVPKSEIGLKIDGACLCKAAAEKTPAVSRRVAKGAEPSPVYKKAALDLTGAFTKIDFGDWGVELAARNDGVAYRFFLAKKGEIVVDGEKATVNLAPDARCWYTTSRHYGCEESLPQTGAFAEIKTGKGFVYLPFVAQVGGTTLAIAESDVYDYPVLNFTKRAGETAFSASFAQFPKKTYRTGTLYSRRKLRDPNGRWVVVSEREAFLTKTAGARPLPWRVFLLADEPAKLCNADIVNALARPAAKGRDFSWVKPGKAAWEWWSGYDHKGMGDGCTTATYKRFIDFAAKTGLEYILMDAGWSADINIWKFNPKVDMPEIIRYGNEKGVGVILWMAWAQVVGQEDKVASHFAKLGVKGFKVDFMDRGDALVERFLWDFAEACAKNKMVVDYHGAHRPTGMSRAYPNVLNYEGVHGLEWMKCFRSGSYDYMANDVGICFLRMTAGPMDYTPGAMDNYTIGQYKGTDNNPGSEGTRCHQMAMMVAYEAPLQVLSDSLTKYEKNMESFTFMSKVPTTWADTIGLGGCPDSFFALARQAKDGTWYAAAIGNKDARDFTLDTAFLGAGTWTMEIFRDAADADKNPTHYVHETKTVKAGDKVPLRFAPGGGFAAKFTKE